MSTRYNSTVDDFERNLGGRELPAGTSKDRSVSHFQKPPTTNRLLRNSPIGPGSTLNELTDEQLNRLPISFFELNWSRVASTPPDESQHFLNEIRETSALKGQRVQGRAKGGEFHIYVEPEIKPEAQR